MDSNFLVLKLPRSGSSMLGKVLNSHQDIYCKNEFLNSVKARLLPEKIEYLKEFFKGNKQGKGKDIKDIKSLGATMNPFKYKVKVTDISKNIDISKFKFILLIRKNFLLQARSFYLVKEVTKGLRFQLDKEDKNRLKEIDFDFNQLERITQRFERRSGRLQKFIEKLSNNNYLFVYYEDLVENRQETFSKIFDYLGVAQPASDFDYNAGREKVLTHDWEALCNNFHEINNYPYLKQFL